MKTRLPHPAGRSASGWVLGCALALCLALSASARAQWVWRDSNGHTVYSDEAPPAGVKSSDILRQPTAPVEPAPAEAGRAPQAPAVQQAPQGQQVPQEGNRETVRSTGPKSLADQELEFRKRQQEREKAEKKQAEDEARAARRAQDCERAQSYLRSLESGTPVMQTDAEGNRQFLDDTQRAAEMRRAREAAAQFCS